MAFFESDDRSRDDGRGRHDNSSFFNPGGMRPAWGGDDRYRDDGYGRYDRDPYYDDRRRRRDDPWSAPGFMTGDVDDGWIDRADSRIRNWGHDRVDDRAERRREVKQRAEDREYQHRQNDAAIRDEMMRNASNYDRGPLDRHENARDAKLGNSARARMKSMSNKSRVNDGEQVKKIRKERITYGGYEKPEATILELIDENIDLVLWGVVIIVGLLVFMVKMMVG